MNVREVIERYNAAWNAHDLDAIDAEHHPEIVFHNHTADERAEGAAAVREHIARILRVQTRVVGEDHVLEPAQFGAGLEPQFLDEQAPALASG